MIIFLKSEAILKINLINFYKNEKNNIYLLISILLYSCSATISYTDYNNKKAPRYLGILKRRKQKNKEFKRQQVE